MISRSGMAPFRLVLDDCVVGVGVDGQGRVAGQGPGGRGPGENGGRKGGPANEGAGRIAIVVVLQVYPELHEYGHVLRFVVVALGHLVVAQGRDAAGAVPDRPIGLVDQVPVPELLQDPPHRLDIRVFEGDVGVLHVDPEADAVGERLPLFHVAHHVLLAGGVELGDAVLLDLRLPRNAETLLDLQLDGQAVGVPTRFAGRAEALHRLVAGHDVLEDPRQDVVDAGAGVGRRGPFEHHVLWPVPTLLHRPLRNIPVLPELQHPRLQLRKTHLARYRFEHLLTHAFNSFPIYCRSFPP